MRLYVLTAQFPYGTGESFLEDELRSLPRDAVEVVVVPMRWWGTERQDVTLERVEELLVDPPGVRLAGSALLEVAKRPARTAGILRELTRDRSHFRKNLIVLPFALSLARRMATQQSRPTHLHAHWLSTNATVAWMISRLEGFPFSVTGHRWDIVDGNLAAVKAKEAQFIRFISESGRQMHEARTGTVRTRRSVIHLGIDTSNFPLCPLAEGLEVVLPANLYPVKGHSTLIRAVRIAKDRGIHTFLRIFGQGGLESELRRLVSDLGIDDQVSFEGHVPRATLLDNYRSGRTKAVVLPSLDLGNNEHEGIPVALMEAMAHGIPVVSTVTGGIPELVSDHSTGLLVPPGDAESLAAALEFLDAEPERVQAMRLAARARVIDEFNCVVSAERLLDLITGRQKDATS